MTVETRPRPLNLLPGTLFRRDQLDDDSASHLVAVIDVGSNSTRMEVLQLTSDYDLRVMSEVKRC